MASSDEPGDVQSELAGYKAAYEQLNAEVGHLRAERDGYKGAYEQIGAEVGQLRGERDGYKGAYEQIGAQLGELQGKLGHLQGERDGYKAAYDELSAEVGGLRGQSAGYKTAYDGIAEEIGEARSTSMGYRRAHDQIAEEISSVRALLRAYQILFSASSRERLDAVQRQGEAEAGPAGVSSFLILGNGRTGSTWLLTSADQLPDVIATLEINWRYAGLEPSGLQHHIDGTTTSLSAAIARTNGLHALPPDQRAKVRVSGGKLIYHPYGFLAPEVFDHIAAIAEPDLKLISLRRSYLEWLLSWKARGVFHELADDVYQTSERYKDRSLDYLTVPQRRPVRTLALTLSGKPLGTKTDEYRDADLYPILDAVDDVLLAFWHDLRTIDLVRARGGLLVEYSEVAAQIPAIASFIGTSASPDEIEQVVARPVTKRLERLSAALFDPPDLLPAITAILDAAIGDIASGARRSGDVWHWVDRYTASIDLPHLRELLDGLGVDCSGRSYGVEVEVEESRLVWRLRKPVYGL